MGLLTNDEDEALLRQQMENRQDQRLDTVGSAMPEATNQLTERARKGRAQDLRDIDAAIQLSEDRPVPEPTPDTDLEDVSEGAPRYAYSDMGVNISGLDPNAKLDSNRKIEEPKWFQKELKNDIEYQTESNREKASRLTTPTVSEHIASALFGGSARKAVKEKEAQRKKWFEDIQRSENKADQMWFKMGVK